MIKVLIKKEEKFVSLKVTGHANSAPHGEDLVCAAVSSVITGGLNSLEHPEDFAIVLKEGNASVEAKKDVSSHDEVVLETIITGLKTIAEGNDKFITITNL